MNNCFLAQLNSPDRSSTPFNISSFSDDDNDDDKVPYDDGDDD